jgi:hypothetical protein
MDIQTRNSNRLPEHENISGKNRKEEKGKFLASDIASEKDPSGGFVAGSG